MNPRKSFFSLFGIMLAVGILARAQGQTEFPVGVFTFGGNNVDYVQMSNDLNFTWIQGYGGTGNTHNAIESNSAGLKVVSARFQLQDKSKAQRHEYQAEATWPGTNPWTYAFFRTRG